MSAPGIVRTGSVAPPALAHLAVLGIACLVWAALFRPEITAAVGVWYDSTAYSHCFLVLPTAAYLAWDRRDALAGVVLRPAPWPAAAAAIPVMVVWFAAERLGVMEGRQFAALALLLLTIFAVIGWKVARLMAAPLLYLVFLVPFGAFLTPVLQQVTLVLSMFFLHLVNVPAVSDGFVIEVPHAVFYVAEACAGLRFLIASIAFGTLYACLIYRSPRRRALFIAASVVIPVVANGIRAFGIVWLGYVLGSAEAAAADHLIYGWIFFSFVILLLILAGLPFRQDTQRAAVATATLMPGVAGARPWAPAALLLLLAAAGPAAAAVLDRTAAAGFAAQPRALPVSGCTGTPVPSGPGGTVTALDCGSAGAFTLRVDAFPPRSTSAAIRAALTRASGAMQAEDAAISTLHVPGAVPDNWTLVETTEPARMTAETAWLDGQPAKGGLAGRLAQARDSLLGASYAPVVVALSWDSPAPRLSRQQADERSRAMADLIARQSSWPAAIAQMSAEAAR